MNEKNSRKDGYEKIDDAQQSGKGYSDSVHDDDTRKVNPADLKESCMDTGGEGEEDFEITQEIDSFDVREVLEDDEDTREVSPEELEEFRNTRSREISQLIRRGYAKDELEGMEQEDLDMSGYMDAKEKNESNEYNAALKDIRLLERKPGSMGTESEPMRPESEPEGTESEPMRPESEPGKGYRNHDGKTKEMMLENIKKRMAEQEKQEEPEKNYITSVRFFRKRYDEVVSELEEASATNILLWLGKARESSEKKDYGDTLNNLRMVYISASGTKADVPGLGYITKMLWNDAQRHIDTAE